MNLDAAHDLHRHLRQIEVFDSDSLDGRVLAVALRSPRPRLAARLVETGALSRSAVNELLDLWESARTIEPRVEGAVSVFEHIYDLVLWVYAHRPELEAPPNGEPTKLLFRGHRDARWSLQTTAERRLTTPEDVLRNERDIASFIAALKIEYPLRLLQTPLEHEAAAQHYGFATNLLDLTTDIDIAACFATDGVIHEERGAIYLADTARLLARGVRFIKLPERFTRPNLQKGLFLSAPQRSGLFRALTFQQVPLDNLTSLKDGAGAYLPEDPVARLAAATSRRAETDASLAHRSPLQLIDDPDYPEALYFGQRITDYAGTITDDATLALHTDILRELTRESPTTVERYLSSVVLLAPTVLLTASAIPPAVGPMLQLATCLGSLWKEIRKDDAWVRRVQRCTLPRSVLLLGAKPENRDEAATRASQFVQRIHGGSEVMVGDLADERTFRQIDALLDFAAEAHFTLVLHNLQRVLDLRTDGAAEGILRTFISLPGGGVATVPSYADGAQLSSHFDVAVSATSIDDIVALESRKEDKLRSFAEALAAPAAERPVGRELARVPLSLQRTLVVEEVPSSLLPSIPSVLRLCCSAYREKNKAGQRIPISAGAVVQVLGGGLTDLDYRHIAETVLDPSAVGADFAAAAAQYVSVLRDDPAHRKRAFLQLNARLELHPMAELVFLALGFVVTGQLRQPFETM